MEPILPYPIKTDLIAKRSDPSGTVIFIPKQSLGNLKYLVEFGKESAIIQSKIPLEIGKTYQTSQNLFTAKKLPPTLNVLNNISNSLQGISQVLVEAFVRSNLPLKHENLLSAQNVLLKSPGNEKIKSRLLALLESKDLDINLLPSLNQLWNLEEDNSDLGDSNFSKGSMGQTLIQLNEREEKHGRWLFIPLEYEIHETKLKGLGKFFIDRLTQSITKWGFDIHSSPPIAFFIDGKSGFQKIHVFFSRDQGYNHIYSNLGNALKESGISWPVEIHSWDEYDGIGDQVPLGNFLKEVHDEA